MEPTSETTSLPPRAPSAPSAPSDNPPTATDGINIKLALDILAERSAKNSSHDDHQHTAGGGCGCQGAGMSDTIKGMGQVIDMVSNEGREIPTEQTEEEKVKAQEQKAQRQREIQAELEGMSIQELLQAVQRVQRDRVSAYREYDSGLEIVLKSGNLTKYPETCAKATAMFAVLSETIKRIQGILSDQRDRKDLAAFIVGLQKYEKEKLQITAAYHLERIRERNESSGEGGATPDARITKLLQDGIQNLKQKLSTCVENINELLDEIRYAVADEA